LSGRGASLGPPLPPSPAKRHARQDLTQKLRAMDQALERIERENSGLCAGDGTSSKENVDPLESYEVNTDGALIGEPRAPPSQSLMPLSNGTTLEPCLASRNTTMAAATAAAAAAAATAAVAAADPQRESATKLTASTTLAREASPLLAPTTSGLATLEAAWREAHCTLREEVARDVAALRAEAARDAAALRDGIRDSEEEKQRSFVRLLADFEVELTSALEARAKETDRLLEQRLVEAGEGLQRQLADFELTVSKDRERLVGLEGDTRRHLVELDEAVRADRVRVTETSQSCGEALQVTKEQLATFRQRIQQLQDDSADSKEQVAALRQRLQQLLDLGSGTVDVDRRIQRLDDAVDTRLREAETGFVTQHCDLENRVQDLQRRIEDVHRRLLADISDVRAQHELAAQRGGSAVAADGRYDDVRRFCDLEFAALRGSVEASELRLAEEMQALRRGLEEVELRGTTVVEAGLCSRLDMLRAELDERWGQRIEHLGSTCAGDARDVALGEVDRQFAQRDEDHRALSRQLEALVDKHHRQQTLIEDLLTAASRKPGGGGAASGASDAWAEMAEQLSGRVASLEARVPVFGASAFGTTPFAGQGGASSSTAVAAADLAERCSGRVDLLASRVASVEERVASFAAGIASRPSHVSAAETTEALRLWPRQLETLSERVDGGRAELRAELRAAEDGAANCSRTVKALTCRVEDREVAHQALAEKVAEQSERIASASVASRAATDRATDAAKEARELRRLAESAESALARVPVVDTAGARERGGGNHTGLEEERGAMVRMEARVELAEARHRIALQEVTVRLDEFSRRVPPAAWPGAGAGPGVGGAEQRRWASRGDNEGTPPWEPPLRDLERELKALLASQAEDSATALRSVAALVEDRLVSPAGSDWRLYDEPSAPRRDRPSTPLRSGASMAWRQ